MKYLILLFLSLTGSVQAQMYYDIERAGEGIVILQQGGLVQFTMFTYADADDCYIDGTPTVGPPSGIDNIICVGGPQAWYVSESTELVNGRAIGVVHSTTAYSYPEISPATGTLGNVFEVASWELLKTETGWAVEFLPFRVTDPLPLDASFYAGPYDFNTRLFGDVPNVD